jgi:wyosine [tRNA(Phe)-imidazoG37] synthetase (radical SAM superfamily)
MTCVFGPVPSRRLGQSLGIDTIPLKTCNWNCVYCQLGRSKPLCNERKDYVPTQTIISEVKTALAAHKREDIDWITFVGSGEPTLHASLGKLIEEVNGLTDIPIAVITNGSLFFMPPIRNALASADAVLPSLDAGSPQLYKKINRPHPDVPFERYVEGLIAFRQEYEGQLWMEVMLVKGLNDTDDALRDIARILAQVRPDKIHIGMPTRPPAETWVAPPDEEGLMRAIAILGEVAQVIHPQEGHFDLSGSENIIDAIVGIITRHPMSEDQLLHALTQFPSGEREKIVEDLKASNRAQLIERFGQRFWCASGSTFPEN